MDREGYKAYYVTAAEFLILASCAGMQQVGGIFRLSPENLPREEIIYGMQSLMQRGILHPGRKITGPLKEMMDVIRDAGSALMVYRNGLDGIASCIYPGAAVVRTRVSEHDRNSLRLQIYEPKEFVKEWMENGGLPSMAQDALEEAVPDTGCFRRIASLPVFTGGTETKWDPGVSAVVERFDLRKQRVSCRIFFVESAGRDYVVRTEDERMTWFLYDEESLRMLLLDLIAG